MLTWLRRSSQIPPHNPGAGALTVNFKLPAAQRRLQQDQGVAGLGRCCKFHVIRRDGHELYRTHLRSRQLRDAGDTLRLEQLLAMLEQSQRTIAASLQKISPEELAREVQSFLGTTTLGQLVFFLYFHETYHTGQTEALRQLAGKDDKVI